jgi:hypothetical protein
MSDVAAGSSETRRASTTTRSDPSHASRSWSDVPRARERGAPLRGSKRQRRPAFGEEGAAGAEVARSLPWFVRTSASVRGSKLPPWRSYLKPGTTWARPRASRAWVRRSLGALVRSLVPEGAPSTGERGRSVRARGSFVWRVRPAPRGSWLRFVGVWLATQERSAVCSRRCFVPAASHQHERRSLEPFLVVHESPLVALEPVRRALTRMFSAPLSFPHSVTPGCPRLPALTGSIPRSVRKDGRTPRTG